MLWTMREDDKIYVLDDSDMVVDVITEDFYNYCKSIGVEFVDKDFSSYTNLLLLLVKHTMLHKNLDYFSYSEFVVVEKYLRDLSKLFDNIVVPDNISQLYLRVRGDVYIIIANNSYVYMISSKVCKTIYVSGINEEVNILVLNNKDNLYRLQLSNSKSGYRINYYNARGELVKTI